jgi:hypothetical protein
MATFLELVKDLARQDGSISPVSITSVENQTGRPEKMVNFIQKAYNNIQNSRRDWGWLTEEFTGTLISGTPIYTAASFNLTRWSNWVEDGASDYFLPMSLRDPAIGLSDEGEIEQVLYEYWRHRYGRGDQSDMYWNRPIEWAITPKKELAFGPWPDAAYTIRGQYQKGPQLLVANADVPEMPARFHDLIVWEALRLLLVHDGAYQESQFPTQEMATLRHELEIDQLPEVIVP